MGRASWHRALVATSVVALVYVHVAGAARAQTDSAPAPESTTTTAAPPTATKPPTTPTLPPTTTTAPPVATTAPAPEVVTQAIGATVTPSTDLVDLQVVTVTGSGFTAGQQVQLQICEAGTTEGFTGCGHFASLAFATADASGGFSAPLTVRRTIRTSRSIAYDCTQAPGACEVAITEPALPNPVLASMPIAFDPSDPGPPLPSIAVSPNTDLVNGQHVSVHVSGYAPDEQVGVTQCQIDPPDFVHCSGAQHQADASGQLEVDVVVRRVLPSTGGPGTPFDCASAPGACGIYALSLNDVVRTAVAPISFDPNAPLPPPGFHAAPLDDLVDGQTVTLTGRVDEVDTWGYAVCATDAPTSPDECDQRETGFLAVGPTGDVRKEIVVHDVLHTASGDVDCRAAPGTCVLVVGRAGPETVASFPLSFRVAAAVPTPGTGQLAFTGDETGGLALAGALALLIGLLLVWVGSRRSRSVR